MNDSKIGRPEVYEFLDYREYLKKFADFLRSQNQFSARTFAKRAGFSSPSFFKMVLDGNRNLSESSLSKLCAALKLQRREADFFETLVRFNQATHLAERDKFYQCLLKFKQFLTITRTAAAEYDYFSKWRIVAVLEALGTAWADLSMKDQAASLECTTKELTEIFKILSTLGLVKNDGKKWKKAAESFTTPPEVASLNVRNHHREMIQKGLEAVDKFSLDERQLGSLTIALSDKDLRDFKKQVFEFLHEMNARYSESQHKSKVCQLNFQLFPLLSLSPGENDLV